MVLKIRRAPSSPHKLKSSGLSSTKPPVYKCGVCEKSTKNKNKMLLHWSKNHVKEKKLCKITREGGLIMFNQDNFVVRIEKLRN